MIFERQRKKSTNKSKSRDKHKKYGMAKKKDTAPYNETWFTTWPSKFETETETRDIQSKLFGFDNDQIERRWNR